MPKVTVGCKLPHGINADIYDPSSLAQGQTPALKQRVTLLGSNSDNAIGGFGITENVDESFMTDWLEQNKSAPYVKSGLIFVVEDVNSARAMASGMADMPNGFEGVNPDKPGDGVEAVNAADVSKQKAAATKPNGGKKK